MGTRVDMGTPMPHLVIHTSPLLQGGKGERGLPGTTGGKGEKGERVSDPGHVLGRDPPCCRAATCGGPWHTGVPLPWGVLLPPMAPRPRPWPVQAEPLSRFPLSHRALTACAPTPAAPCR